MAYEDRLTDIVDIYRKPMIPNEIGGYREATPSSDYTTGESISLNTPAFIYGLSDNEIIQPDGIIALGTDAIMLLYNVLIKPGDYVYRHNPDGTIDESPYIILKIRKAPTLHHLTLECQYQD